MLNREQILKAKDRPQQVMHIEEWGGDVTITALSVRDRSLVLAEWSRLGTQQKEGGDPVAAMLDVKLYLVALSITDKDGKPLFTTEDMAALANKSDGPISAISDAAIVLNRFLTTATEEAAKN